MALTTLNTCPPKRNQSLMLAANNYWYSIRKVLEKIRISKTFIIGGNQFVLLEHGLWEIRNQHSVLFVFNLISCTVWGFLRCENHLFWLLIAKELCYYRLVWTIYNYRHLLLKSPLGRKKVLPSSKISELLQWILDG